MERLVRQSENRFLQPMFLRWREAAEATHDTGFDAPCEGGNPQRLPAIVFTQAKSIYGSEIIESSLTG